jgi:hypothetical protein
LKGKEISWKNGYIYREEWKTKAQPLSNDPKYKIELRMKFLGEEEGWGKLKFMKKKKKKKKKEKNRAPKRIKWRGT